jgi:hypothetical protein
VISDSSPWKAELVSFAAAINRRARQKRWTERTGFLVERDIMLGAYAIRKLLDAPGKVSDEARSAQVGIVRHSLTGPPPDYWSVYELWEHYDLENGVPQAISLREFCNQIIHSFGWFMNGDLAGKILEGVFVCSDRESLRSVVYIPIGEVVAAFERIGLDDVVYVEMRRGPDGRRRVVKASSQFQ